MARKILAIADSSNPTIIEYMKSQLESIEKQFSGVTTELVDEKDSRLVKYIHSADRVKLPMLMAFKGDVYTAMCFGKRDTAEIIDWCKGLGIE